MEDDFNPPEWSEVASKMKEAFPEADISGFEKQYNQSRSLYIARKDVAKDYNPDANWTLRAAVSFPRNILTGIVYGRSKKRFAEGNAEGDDFRNIAIYEAEQQADAEASRDSWGRSLGQTALSLPSQAAGFMLGAKAAGAIPALAGAGAAPAVGRIAAGSALTPNVGLEQGIHSNIENNRDPLDPKGLATGVGLGMAQLAVLGGASKAVGAAIPGAGQLTSIGAQALSGPVAQAATDMTTYGLGLSTKYGTVQDLYEGRSGDAAKHAVSQVLMFGAFAAMHGNPEKGKEIVNQFAQTTDSLAKRGFPANEAVKKAAEKAKDLFDEFVPETQKGEMPAKAPGVDSPASAPEGVQKPVEAPPTQPEGPKAGVDGGTGEQVYKGPERRGESVRLEKADQNGRHAILDADGKDVGGVMVTRRGDAIYISQATGEIGPKSWKGILRGLADQYPDAAAVEFIRTTGPNAGKPQRVPLGKSARGQKVDVSDPEALAKGLADLMAPKAEPAQVEEMRARLQAIGFRPGKWSAEKVMEEAKKFSLDKFAESKNEPSPVSAPEAVQPEPAKEPTPGPEPVAKVPAERDPQSQPEPAPAKQSLMDRIRARQQAQGEVAAPKQRLEPVSVKPSETSERPEPDRLTERERIVLSRREAGDKLEDIGKDLGVSKQRIKQIEEAALAKSGKDKSVAEEVFPQEAASRIERVEEEMGLRGRDDRFLPQPILREKVIAANRPKDGARIGAREIPRTEKEIAYDEEVDAIIRRLESEAARSGHPAARVAEAVRRGEAEADNEVAQAVSRTEAGSKSVEQSARTGPVGSSTEIALPDGGTIPARYEVREIGDVRASHQVVEGGALRSRVSADEYPAGLQPRDYSTPSEQAKIDQIGLKLNPSIILSNHPAASEGPPTITRGNTVINGNGRQMGLERSVQSGRYEAYKEELIRRAKDFGIDPESVRGMKNPALYRVVDMEASSPEAKAFAAAGNVSLTMGQSPLRTAASLGRLITPDVIEQMKLEGDTTFSEAVTDPSGGRAFRQALRDALPAQEVPRFFNSDGMLTDSGKELVRNMLLAKVFKPELLERMGEEYKSMKRAIEGVTPQLIELMRDHPESNIAPQLAEAINVRLRNPSIRTLADVENVVGQESLFGGKTEPVSPGGRMLLDFITENAGKPNVFRQKMSDLLKDLSGKNGLFSEKLPDPAEMVAENLGVAQQKGATFGPEPTVKDKLDQVAEGALKRIKDKAARLSSGFDPTLIPDLVTYVGAKLAKGLITFGEYTKSAIEKFGEGIKPHLQDIWRQAVAVSNQIKAGEKQSGAEGPIGIKNVSAAELRETAKLPPVAEADPVGHSFPELRDQVARIASTEPARIDQLVAELSSEKRPVTDLEDALLLWRENQVRNEYTKSLADLVQAQSAGNPGEIALAEKAEQFAIQRLREITDVSKAVGTESGRGLNARKMMVREDFSLANMIMQKEAAKGRPLTTEEKNEIVELQKKIEELQSKREGETARTSDAGFDLDTLKKKWRREIEDDKLAQRPWQQKALSLAGEVANVPRSLMASIDFPLLRQGMMAMLSHPIRTSKGIPEMIRSFFSEGAANRAQYEIENRANAGLYKRSGLEITTTDGPLTAREEGFMSRLIGKAPIVGPLARASSRAYQVSLNRIRADGFDAMASALSEKGKLTLAESKVIANYMNVMTGRGNMGKAQPAAAFLTQVFFAPRYALARFQTVLGQPLWTAPGQGGTRARVAVAKEYARVAAGLGVALGAAALAGFDLEKDARSPDFGKLKIENTRLDMTGGLSSVATYLSRMLSGEKKSPTGKVSSLKDSGKFGQDTAADVTWRFIRGKLAPVPSAALDTISGSNVVGEPVGPADAAAHTVTPLFARDVYEAMIDLGVPRGTAVSLLGLLGMSMQTYQPRKKFATVGPR